MSFKDNFYSRTFHLELLVECEDWYRQVINLTKSRDWWSIPKLIHSSQIVVEELKFQTWLFCLRLKKSSMLSLLKRFLPGQTKRWDLSRSSSSLQSATWWMWQVVTAFSSTMLCRQATMSSWFFGQILGLLVVFQLLLTTTLELEALFSSNQLAQTLKLLW